MFIYKHRKRSMQKLHSHISSGPLSDTSMFHVNAMYTEIKTPSTCRTEFLQSKT